MCEASVVADDWVNKGFHIHIDEVELCIVPDHKKGVQFKTFFSLEGYSQAELRRVQKALDKARNECLPDDEVRKRWIRTATHATAHMLGYQGALESLANGRMLEFKFLILALERYEA